VLENRTLAGFPSLPRSVSGVWELVEPASAPVRQKDCLSKKRPVMDWSQPLSTVSRSQLATVSCVSMVLLLLFTATGLPQSAAKAQTRKLTVLEAFQQKKSRLFLETSGTVIKLLADDEQGSRHQRFLIKTDDGPTLLVSHNIDLSERVPLKSGIPVQIRGEYIWNTKGGLMHWTHRDPKGRHEGGWIKILKSARVYQ
jgi:Protein of unknown function (DUF3465)